MENVNTPLSVNKVDENNKATTTIEHTPITREIASKLENNPREDNLKKSTISLQQNNIVSTENSNEQSKQGISASSSFGNFIGYKYN